MKRRGSRRRRPRGRRRSREPAHRRPASPPRRASDSDGSPGESPHSSATKGRTLLQRIRSNAPVAEAEPGGVHPPEAVRGPEAPMVRALVEVDGGVAGAADRPLPGARSAWRAARGRCRAPRPPRGARGRSQRRRKIRRARWRDFAPQRGQSPRRGGRPWRAKAPSARRRRGTPPRPAIPGTRPLYEARGAGLRAAGGPATAWPGRSRRKTRIARPPGFPTLASDAQPRSTGGRRRDPPRLVGREASAASGRPRKLVKRAAEQARGRASTSGSPGNRRPGDRRRFTAATEELTEP